MSVLYIYHNITFVLSLMPTEYNTVQYNTVVAPFAKNKTKQNKKNKK